MTISRREPSQRMSAVVLAVAIAFSGDGCSWIFVTPSRTGGSPTPNNSECTKSEVAPLLDVAAATLQALNAAVSLSSPDKMTQAQGGFSVGFAGMYIASAIYGFRNTSECVDFIRGEWSDDGRPRRVRRRSSPDASMFPSQPVPPLASPPPPPDLPPPPPRPVTTPDGGVQVPEAPPVPQKVDDE